MPTNGPRAKTTTGRNRRTVRNIASKGGNMRTALKRDRTNSPGAIDAKPASGGTEKPKPAPFDPAASLKKMKEIRESRAQSQTTRSDIPLPGAPNYTAATNAYTQAAATTGLKANLTALALAASRQGGGGGGGNPGGGVMKQLSAGFRSAGDTAMARFVKRNPHLMRVWLGQESGMRRNAVSPPNNQGDPNYGYFQFARLDPGARPWLERFITKGGQGFSASAFQQARLAAKYFDLTPSDVRTYVQQIRSGTYKGWG